MLAALQLGFLGLSLLLSILGGLLIACCPSKSSAALGGLVLCCTSLLIFAMYIFTRGG